MRRFSNEERRARLGTRHHLAAPALDVVTAAGDLVGLHSSDPVTVYLSARARVSDFTPGDLENALYEQRSLVRALGMRRTMFVVPREMVPLLDIACARTYVTAERRRLENLLRDQGIAADPAAWLDDLLDRTLAAIEARGQATAKELVEDVPQLAERFTFGEGKSWGGTVGVSTRVLFFLATGGRIVRARPLGSWVSSQYRWAPFADWLGAPLPEIGPEQARVELVRRWLAAYGPGTLTDIKWWSGWTMGQTRKALDAVEAVEAELDGGIGFVLPDDLDEHEPPDDWVALLPSLDPAVMGWKERSWLLGEHGPQLFDRNGNAGPTVWWNGRVGGGWTQPSDGEIEYELW